MSNVQHRTCDGVSVYHENWQRCGYKCSLIRPTRPAPTSVPSGGSPRDVNGPCPEAFLLGVMFVAGAIGGGFFVAILLLSR